MTAFLRVFRSPEDTGRRGWPRLGLATDCLRSQGVKQDAKRRGVRVKPRVVQGTASAIAAVRAATGTGHGIPTAYLERLSATVRGALAPLVRRGRARAHKVETLTAGRDLVGGAYHCCWTHGSLRGPAPAGSGRTWQERTPALAAGLTEHPWTTDELLGYPVPLPAWVPPKRRGRPPKAAPPPLLAVAS